MKDSKTKSLKEPHQKSCLEIMARSGADLSTYAGSYEPQLRRLRQQYLAEQIGGRKWQACAAPRGKRVRPVAKGKEVGARGAASVALSQVVPVKRQCRWGKPMQELVPNEEPFALINSTLMGLSVREFVELLGWLSDEHKLTLMLSNEVWRDLMGGKAELLKLCNRVNIIDSIEAAARRIKKWLDMKKILLPVESPEARSARELKALMEKPRASVDPRPFPRGMHFFSQLPRELLDAIGDHLFAVEKIRLRVACKAIFCEYFQDDGQESQAQAKKQTAIEKFADWAKDMREEHCRELEEEARRVAELRAKAQEAREQYAEQQLERAKTWYIEHWGKEPNVGYKSVAKKFGVGERTLRDAMDMYYEDLVLELDIDGFDDLDVDFI